MAQTNGKTKTARKVHASRIGAQLGHAAAYLSLLGFVTLLGMDVHAIPQWVHFVLMAVLLDLGTWGLGWLVPSAPEEVARFTPEAA